MSIKKLFSSIVALSISYHAGLFPAMPKEKATLVGDPLILNHDITSEYIEQLKNELKGNTIKNLTIAQETEIQGNRLYIDVEALTALLELMPHLKHCTLSNTALHHNEESHKKFVHLGEQLFRTQQIEINNSSIGLDGIDWIQKTLQKSKLKELTLNNIYTRESHNFEEDNYTDPEVFTGEKEQFLLNNARLCPTMQQLTLNKKTIDFSLVQNRKE
jgi:hypothetical protein